MGDKPESSDSPKPAASDSSKSEKLHKAYSVTNITTKIRTLDGKKVTYSQWVKQFKLHARAFQVTNHIDGTDPTPKDHPLYAEWSELDALVVQWIYNSISDDLFSRILEDPTTARSAWNKLQEIFINNKHARAATLEQKFINTTLSSCASFDDYCQKLKDIASQLDDIDQPVSESRLVIQMVRGLPNEYDTIGAIINQSCPSWDDARGMIEAEQQRQSGKVEANRDHALISQTSSPNNSSTTANLSRSPYPNGYKGRNYDPAKAARGRGQLNRGGRNGPRGGRFSSYQAHTNYGPNSWATIQQPGFLNSNQYGPQFNQFSRPPPSPYPSHAAQQLHHQAHIASPQQFGNMSQFGNALCPSDIGSAMATMNLNNNDQWYMDTGASSHITANQGPQGWTPPFPTQ